MGARTEKPHDRLYDFSCIGPLAWSSSERAKCVPAAVTVSFDASKTWML